MAAKGSHLTEEHKKKLSVAHMGRKASDETKRKMSVVHKGYKPTKEQIERIRQFNLGKKLSPETKQRIGLAGKGRKLTTKTKNKMSVSKMGHTTSEETKTKLRLIHGGKPHPNQQGKNHWNWRGGASRAYKTGFYSVEYKEWRKKVFERDGYRCVKCAMGGYLTAHHIKSFAKYPDLRYDVNNGLTLCEPCHRVTDNYGGHGRVKHTNTSNL